MVSNQSSAMSVEVKAATEKGCETCSYKREAGAVAALAEERKKAKYLDLARTHHFVAVVVETAGGMGSDALDFFADIGSRVKAATNEAQSRAFILQQVSVALQRGNAASVLGTFG